MSTARKMQASLYNWIVYQLRYKAKERKGEKEDGWYSGLIQISYKGRQGASGRRANSRKQYRTVLPFAKVLRKSKLSEPHTRRRSFYNNAFTTTKNKSYFIKLVNKTIK